MFKITQEQKEALIKAFYSCNAPVQLYEAVIKMLQELPLIQTETTEKVDEKAQETPEQKIEE